MATEMGPMLATAFFRADSLPWGMSTKPVASVTTDDFLKRHVASCWRPIIQCYLLVFCMVSHLSESSSYKYPGFIWVRGLRVNAMVVLDICESIVHNASFTAHVTWMNRGSLHFSILQYISNTWLRYFEIHFTKCAVNCTAVVNIWDCEGILLKGFCARHEWMKCNSELVQWNWANTEIIGPCETIKVQFIKSLDHAVKQPIVRVTFAS